MQNRAVILACSIGVLLCYCVLQLQQARPVKRPVKLSAAHVLRPALSSPSLSPPPPLLSPTTKLPWLRLPRPPPPPPSPPQPSVVPLASCDAYGECVSPAELARRYAVDNTLVVTFGNDRQQQFTVNWVGHMQRLHVRGLLVGMMNMNASMPSYVRLAASLRARGVGVYLVNSPEVAVRPQGGRWFHLLPLLRTGCRLLFSDSDAVWLRNPLPYLRRLEARHPRLDMAVSTDAQDGTDGLRLGGSVGRQGVLGSYSEGSRHTSSLPGGDETAAAEAAAAQSDLDIEAFRHCWWSMNIGVIYFPPSSRAGAVRAIEEATQHMAAEPQFWQRRTIYVDQGPMNFRWKHGAGKEGINGSFRWPKQVPGRARAVAPPTIEVRPVPLWKCALSHC